jgi:hypothetical protein
MDEPLQEMNNEGMDEKLEGMMSIISNEYTEVQLKEFDRSHEERFLQFGCPRCYFFFSVMHNLSRVMLAGSVAAVHQR